MNRSSRHGNLHGALSHQSAAPTDSTGSSPVAAAGGYRRVSMSTTRAAGGGGSGSVGSSPTHQARSKRHLEGVLSKYTNMLQGWQTRFFVLDPEVSQLQYYLNAHSSSSQRPPRGSMSLLGASVVSSDEFPHMFTIHSANGDFYKLRALDAQEQQLWMTQLQLCSRRHSDSSAKVINQAEGQQKNLVNSIESLPPRGGPLSSLDEDLLLLKATSAATLSCLGECLSMLQHNVSQALTTQYHSTTASHNHISNHSPCSPSPSHNQTGDPIERIKSWSQRCTTTGNQAEPAFVKSGSQSPRSSLGESHESQSPSPKRSGHNHIQSEDTHADSLTGRPASPPEKQTKNRGVSPLLSTPSPSSTQTQKDLHANSEQQQQQGQVSSPELVDPSEETTDTEDNEEEDLGVLDDQRSIILHLLSQLKLGMDLTRVVLPTFILEKRSLLEMYANFMAHPDMFLSITSGSTAEERIVRFVEYYLTAFHEGRKGAVAKKPYNPILGENFRCSWQVPRDRVRPLRNNSSSTTGPNAVPAASQSGDDADCYRVRFVAEQVSHHPPVSGFYYECKERRTCLNTHVWTKSKFMGMSVGVSMVGEGVLYLLEHDEEYVFTLPCAYARSILTVPWVELGGKVTISCAKSGYAATVTFHTKPFYGGKVHRVTAEVKHNQTGTIVCKAQGEWNGTLEFTYSSGETKVIDTSKLPIIKKRLRPMEKQSQYESRRLWQHVTASLKTGDMDQATGHKHRLEERQRSEGKERAATKTPWKPKYFVKEGEGWVYHNPLWKTH